MWICSSGNLRRRAGRFSFFAFAACSSALQAQHTPSPQNSQVSTAIIRADANVMTQAFSTLNQPVELSCHDEPLDKALASLQEQSGVTLKVNSGWIGALPVTAYTRKMPLGTMLQRLASLHDLSWRQEATILPDVNQPVPPASSPVACFVLYESSANQRDITRLKRLSWEPLRLRVAHIREYAGYTDEQLAQMAKQGDNQAQSLLAPNTRNKVALLAYVDDDMLEALIDKEAKTLGFAQLSPRAQQAIRFLVADKNAHLLTSWQHGKEQGQPVSQTPPANIVPEDCSVCYTVYGEGTSANLHYTLLKGKSPLVMDSAMGGSGGDGKVWWLEWYARGQRTVLPAQSAEVRKVPEDTLFAMTDWPEVLRLMRDKWQVNVFSDAYPEVPAVDKLSQVHSEIEKAGESLADGLTRSSLWNRKWWQEGRMGTDILFLRSDWYNWRDDGNWYALSLRLKQAETRKEALTLEDLVRVATLLEARLYALTIKPPVSGKWDDANRDILWFYGGLKDAEKRRLWNGGLQQSALSLVSQRRLLQAVQSVNARATEDWLRDTSLYLKAANGTSKFYFKVDDSANPLSACQWQIKGVPTALAVSVEGGQQGDTSK